MGLIKTEKRTKIAVASYDDPRSVSTWSGIPAHIIAELEKQDFEVISIALKKPIEPWYYNWLRRLHWRASKKWFLSSVDKRFLKDIGRQMDRHVEQNNPDIVLAIFADILAYTTFSQPACTVHDATFAGLINYYSSFTSLTAGSIRAGNDMYKRALARADAAIFSSEWASKSAINDYNVSSKRVYTIPFGANINHIPSNDDVVDWQVKRKGSVQCNLLFVGIDWDRKGGPFALHVVQELNKLQIKARLTIVGSDPIIPAHQLHYVNKIGFLDKNKLSDVEVLKKLFIESNALLLPSVAECFGCVYCEANAFGLPALGRDTGGVSEIIKDGVNGLLIGERESAEDFAKRWASLWMDKSKYAEMLHLARVEFAQRLNYEVFVKKLTLVFQTIIYKHI